MCKQNSEIAPTLEPTVLIPSGVTNALLRAMDRVVLRGQPIGDDSAIVVADRSILPSWPLKIQIGETFLYLHAIYYKNGAQEAMYERRR